MHPNWNTLQKMVELWLSSNGLRSKQVFLELAPRQTAVIRIKNKPRPRESIREDSLGRQDWKTIFELPFEERDMKILFFLQKRKNQGVTEKDFPKKSRGSYPAIIQCQNRINTIFRRAGVKYRFKCRYRYGASYKIMVKRVRSK